MPNTPKPSDPLQKLLRLKRWSPPKEHQERLSARIIAQIEVERATGPGWWSQIAGSLLNIKPALACAYSVAAMGLLFFGLSLNEERPHSRQSFPSHPNDFPSTVRPADNTARPEILRLPNSEILLRELSAHHWKNTAPSMQPIMTSPLPPLFPTTQRPPLPHSTGRQPAPFSIDGNRLLQPASFQH